MAKRGAAAFLGLTTILLLALASCGSSNGFSDSYMALDAAGERRRTTFFTDTEQIFCIAELAGAKKGTTVNATLRQVGQDNRAVNMFLGIGENVAKPTAKNTLSFELAPDKPVSVPWPPGKFSCDLMVDGVLKTSVPFDILMPNCPVYGVQQATRCGGFYPPNIKCPGIDQNVGCICGPDTGVWLCPQ